MSLWVLTSVLAYFLLALSGVFDKFFLSKSVKNPSVYVFFVGISSIVVLVLAPFGFQPLPVYFQAIALLAGSAFAGGLWFLYRAIKATSVSRVLPLEGGLVPVFTLVFAYFFLGTSLSPREWVAFLCLVLGAVVVVVRKDDGKWYPKALFTGLLGAVSFAISFVLSKLVYENTNFINGLIWTRFGLILSSASFLLIRSERKAILGSLKSSPTKHKILFYAAQAIGGLSALLQNYSVAIGNVVFVNALQGTQYVFALILTAFISTYFPSILKERVNLSTVIQKVFAIILVSIGLILLAQANS